MELLTRRIGKTDRLVIAPLGDIQWTGDIGSTAQDHLRRHIDHCLELGAWFVGLGDYIDLMSPSNRRRLLSADLYDTAQQVLRDKAMELVDELFEKFLKPTAKRWLGLVEGHHFYEAFGETSDEYLATKLDAPFLGTSAYVRVMPADVTLLLHHGLGSGVLPGVGLNKLYHWSAGLTGADVLLMGHNTKLATTRRSIVYPDWEAQKLIHKDIWLVNTGGFCRSNIVGYRIGGSPRGDYAEQGMMTPSPLSAPIVDVRISKEGKDIRVAI